MLNVLEHNESRVSLYVAHRLRSCRWHTSTISNAMWLHERSSQSILRSASEKRSSCNIISYTITYTITLVDYQRVSVSGFANASSHTVWDSLNLESENLNGLVNLTPPGEEL